MTTHAYSPHTGELIQTETIAPWMSTTDIDPPQFDAATQSAFFRDGAWVVEDAQTTEPVPASVSRAQGKAALIQANLWDQVTAYVDGIADATQKALAQVALNDTQEWRRDSPFLNQAADALGITGAEMDALFVAAAKIVL